MASWKTITQNSTSEINCPPLPLLSIHTEIHTHTHKHKWKHIHTCTNKPTRIYMKLLSGKILYRILGQTLQRRNVEEMELNEYIQNVFLPIFLACLIVILHLLSLMSSIIYAFLHIYLYVYIFKKFFGVRSERQIPYSSNRREGGSSYFFSADHEACP